MIVVNFWGGPGSGKSSIAAKLFAHLKTKQSVTCELVTEYAKDLVWSNRYHCLINQPYVSTKQFYRLEKLNNKIDIAITDSPIPLGLVYAENKYNLNHTYLNCLVCLITLISILKEIKKLNIKM